MPLYACAVGCVLWESCPVTRSPSCGRLHRQTVRPLPPPTCAVSSSTYLFGWTDPGAVPDSNGANPQTDAPRSSSLPCQRYDGAPSVYHAYPTPCTPPLQSCDPGGVLHVQTAELWKSPLVLLRRLFLPNIKHYLRAAPTWKFYIRRIEEALCLPGGV